MLNTKLRTALFLLTAIAVTAFGLLAYLRLSLRHAHIGFFTTHDVEVLTSAANEARVAVAQNKACVFPIDESGRGDRKQEAEMLYIAAMLNLYRAKFGVAARSLADLDRLSDFDRHNGLDRRRLEKDCSLYVDPSGATVVSCGGSMPLGTELTKFISGAEFVQRFYSVGESEVLYIPSPKC